MIGRLTRLGVLSASIAIVSGFSTQAQPNQARSAAEGHVTWVIDSLRRMQTIKVGMTRADLLKLFEPDGGLWDGRVYVFRDCRYFKVEVEWEQPVRISAGRTVAERTAAIEGLPGDVIRRISRPYIEGMKID